MATYSRILDIFQTLAANIAADPDAPVPLTSIFLGGEHISDHAIAPRIVFEPVDGVLVMADQSGFMAAQPSPTSANPQHLRTWWMRVAIGIWGGTPLPWQPETRYQANQFVLNGGKSYVCSTAGVTGNSGGPSGTGTNIPDGTAAWNFQSPNQVKTLFEFDQVFNILQAVVRAHTNPTSGIPGSWKPAGQIQWMPKDKDAATLGRALVMPVMWMLTVVAPTLPEAPQAPNASPLSLGLTFSFNN